MTLRRAFLSVSLLCLILQVVGALLSIALAMPAQVAFGDAPTPPSAATPGLVAQEFLSKGTALAPPLAPMVAFAVFLLLATRARALGVIGTVLLVLLGILFTAATIGEYPEPDRFVGMPAAAYLALLLLNQVVVAGVVILGILRLARWRSAVRAPQEESPALERIGG
ncbi:hypothetical protein [Naasia sp. SYSU D00948]|uniref:hypothetical protein n=1 Tax=Naasia sp. SYSU D00948 TaxID=2817379 RepID=UPI001B310766|nr:hypothetical protein [Naasia sp. SYSU D00948]